MSTSITQNERMALKSALATGGRLRFQALVKGQGQKTRVEIFDGVTVVSSRYGDFDAPMQSRGWVEYVEAPKVFKLSEAGIARAKRIR